eukprot:955073-Prymnesium_polylepis.1
MRIWSSRLLSIVEGSTSLAAPVLPDLAASSCGVTRQARGHVARSAEATWQAGGGAAAMRRWALACGTGRGGWHCGGGGGGCGHDWPGARVWVWRVPGVGVGRAWGCGARVCGCGASRVWAWGRSPRRWRHRSPPLGWRLPGAPCGRA